MRQTGIKYVDMTEALQKEAIDCAIHAMNNYNAEKDFASYIKKEFDRLHHTWQCIVGRNFGSSVTHVKNVT